MELQAVFSMINTLSLEEIEALRDYVEVRHQELIVSADADAVREGQLRMSDVELQDTVTSLSKFNGYF